MRDKSSKEIKANRDKLMFFLPFLIKNKNGFLFYPGSPELENLNFKKIKIFNHNYYSGNLKEIKEIISSFSGNLKEKALRAIENYKKVPEFFKVKDKKFFLKSNLYFIGILNVTPDSFSDGGDFLEKDKAVERALKLAEEGADIIDIGGESTRPGSEPISAEEEMERVIPVIEKIKKLIDIPISIDTTKAIVAEEALKNGASILNDISALHFDERMVEVIEKYKPSVILMHIKGRPKDMQNNTNYEHFPFEILKYLSEGIEKAIQAGIDEQKIIVDPGIGFGKSFDQNLWILKNLNFLKNLGFPILIGTSRKSFIGKILGLEPKERIYGTISSNLVAFKNGASFLRVHDVKPHKDFFKVLREIEDVKLV